MAKPCSICEHPRRGDIENAYVLEKKTGQHISRQFGISAHQFTRHKAHIVRKSEAVMPKDQSDSVLGKLYQLAMREYDESDDAKVRVAALGRAQSIAVDVQRTAGDKSADPSEWADHPANSTILDGIMMTLERDHPKALQAVLDYMLETIGESWRPIPRGIPALDEEGGGGFIGPPEPAAF